MRRLNVFKNGKATLHPNNRNHFLTNVIMQHSITHRANTTNRTASRKFDAAVRTGNNADLNIMSKSTASETHFRIVLMLATLGAYLIIVTKLLLQVHCVKMADVGSFRLSLPDGSAKAQETCKPVMITKTKQHFRPGKEIAKAIRNIEFCEKPSTA